MDNDLDYVLGLPSRSGITLIVGPCDQCICNTCYIRECRTADRRYPCEVCPFTSKDPTYHQDHNWKCGIAMRISTCVHYKEVIE